jgi:hypothetical protein
MEYQKAKDVRGTSFGDLMSKKLIEGGGIGGSLGATISEKTKAKMTGIKQSFDPLNMAKFMTGGSSLGPALLGKIMGRSKKDIKFFAGKTRKGRGGSTLDKLMGENNEISSILYNIEDLLKKALNDDELQKEKENNFAEENDAERLRRHRELIEAITGKKYSGKASATKMSALTGETGGLNFGLNFRINPARAAAKASADAASKGVAATATKVAGEANKEVIKKSATKQLSKSIGKGALKSIPILGLAVGAGFAIGRLLEGDVVGAGIDAASGVGSALTAIPLTLTNAARDVYKDVYGNYPDPTNSQDQKNLSEIYDIVKEVASELLKNSAGPADNDMQYDALSTAMAGVPMTTESPSVTPKISPSPSNAAAPMPSPNVGSALQSVQSQNLDMKIPVSNEDPSIAISNTTKVSNTSTKEKKNLPAVRNLEETFQRMILYSTRVV